MQRISGALERGELEGMQERDGGGGGVQGDAGEEGVVGGRWSTEKPLRMAVLPDTGSD